MATFSYLHLFFFFTLPTILLYFSTSHRRKTTSSTPTNWPLLGMLPGLLRNCHRIHDYATDVLIECGGTFLWKGPSLCNMDFLLTSHPPTIHHILSKNFSNYAKGLDFNRIFEILGDGIFNADFHLWEFHRRTTLSFTTHAHFNTLLENAVWERIQTGLQPVLDHFCSEGVAVDLQDIFQRFTFDTTCKFVLDYDPRTLCVEMPYCPCQKAINDALEALLYRHVLPESFWRLQKWLRIGNEKKLEEAWAAFDDFIYPCLDRIEEEEVKNDLSLLSSFRSAYEEEYKTASPETSRKFLRDTALSLIMAGRDTTSACLTWLFWLISQNPSSETKIRQEIKTELHLENRSFFTAQESKKLVYLHGALCESLRLFPPLALEHKTPMRQDSLPCGQTVAENTRIFISFYSVGRMESVWGGDCMEFKPERWITARGGTKHEASYKFVAFNAGPRTCLGREMAFIQMKMVAAIIIHRYNVRVVEGKVFPRDSILLHTRHGLRVCLSTRN